jgi:hypothetical protein
MLFEFGFFEKVGNFLESFVIFSFLSFAGFAVGYWGCESIVVGIILGLFCGGFYLTIWRGLLSA